MAKSRPATRRRSVPVSLRLVLFGTLAVGLGYLLLADLPALFRDVLAPTRVVYKPGLSEPPTAAKLEDELHCLALNIYFEARSEPDIGKVAVAHVVMNRVRDRRFPQTVCDVVRQGGEDTKHECQFSWWCDGESDDPGDSDAWSLSTRLAEQVYWDRTFDPTDGALWYHADYVDPYWKAAFQPVRQLGRHVFYQAAAD